MTEEEVLKFWQENKIFEKTLAKPSPKGEFVFYEGPPTANGKPGIHHLESRAFKDLIPRYKTMRGHYVRRKAGWDTHGLPVEIEVEKELGLKSKKDIERYGIAKFNQQCRESVWKYLAEWEKFTDRIGFWLDQKNAYATYQPPYIESLWWILKKVHERNLLYKDYKVLPWCPRCGTALSSHELAQGYEEVEDPAVTVKFKVKNPQARGLPENTFLLAWTTTPWTLPGNVALAVGKDVEYVLMEMGGEHLIVSRKLASRGGSPVSASQLFGLQYEPLFNFKELQNEKSHRVYPADFVSTDEGTGIVHTAVMYGVGDFELGQKIGLPKHHLVAEDGTFKDGTPWAGRFVKEVDPLIIADLENRGLILKTETIRHTYPFCWRCQTPVIYYARDSWFIKMSALREELIKENQKIHWVPEHVRDGRFGEWLREVKDWAISRERYWGTPLPIWQRARTDADKTQTNAAEYLVVGSLEELKRYTKKSGNLYFVMRHGEAENNVKEILSSRPDNPHHLTDKGREEVKQAAEKLRDCGIDLIIASDFVRGRETAEIAAQNLGLPLEQIVYDERLREVNHGDLNLKPIEEYRGYYQTVEERFRKPMPHGEDFRQIKQRVGGCLYELEKKHKNKKILIVSHESPIWLLAAAAAGLNLQETIALRGQGEFFFQNAEWRPLDFIPLPHNEDFELDLHRPYIDDLKLITDDNRPLKRVPEVADVWFDSGAMPFAQDHYPFAKTDLLYPADFISEAIDQTRGWFYTLLAVGVLMERGTPYKNVICLGHVLDKTGRKMSKSLGNAPDPAKLIEKFGADTLRFWMYVINQPGDGKNFDEATVADVANKVFNPLLNVLNFYGLYAKAAPTLVGAALKSKNILDRWVIALLRRTIQTVTASLEAYQVTTAARALRDFITDLSQWYVRRSRERFKDENEEKPAGATLCYVLLELAKLLAPFAPFTAEAIYQEVKEKNQAVSIHLLDWPAAEASKADEIIIAEMAAVRRIVSLGLEARSRANIRVRQPLKSVKLKTKSEKFNQELVGLIKDELNVKEVIFDPSLAAEVELDTALTPALQEEGALRELVRQIQDFRKEHKLKPGEKISVTIAADKNGEKLVKKFADELKKTCFLKAIRLNLTDKPGFAIILDS